MKIILFVSLFCVVGFASVTTQTPLRSCIYVLGVCVRECDEGTHAFTTGCSPVTPEATCDQPHPRANPFDTCDYEACYCNPPTVRDTISNKCVLLEDCPKTVTHSL